MADIPGGHVLESFNAQIPENNTPPGIPPETPPGTPPGTPTSVDWYESAKPVVTELFENEEAPTTADDFKTRLKAERAELRTLREQGKTVNKEAIEASQARIAELEAEREELLKDINPLSHFSSEAAYRAEQLKMKFPDNNPQAIEQIISADFGKMTPIDILRLNLVFEYGITNQEEQNTWIEKKYQVDLTDEEAVNDVMMKTDSRDILKGFKKIKETEVPQMKDYNAIKEQRVTESKQKVEGLKTAWSPIIEKAITGLQKLTIPFKDAEGKPDNFEFIIPEESLKPYISQMVDRLSTTGRELSEDNLKAAVNSVYERVLLDNFYPISRAYTNKKLAELDEKWSSETHNPRKINQEQRPPSQEGLKPNSKEEAEATIMRG